MRKILLCSAIALMWNAPVIAQWVISGGNASIYNTGNGTQVVVGSTSPGKTYGAISTSQDASGYVALHSVSASGSTYGNLILNPSGGYVGIGTTSPSAKFEVFDGNGTGVISYFGAIGVTNAKGLYLSRPAVNTNPVNIQGSQHGVGPADLSLQAEGGNVGIGTSNPHGYKLAVNGAAIATSMKVKLQANWPDFVFLRDYKLPTLTEVKTYIDKNQHLPDMPSAGEVHTNGLDLGEMNRLLLKKVEELTLYLIEKDSQIAEQRAKEEKREARLVTLELALEKLIAER